MTGIGIGAGFGVVGIGPAQSGVPYSPLTEAIFLNEGGTANESVQTTVPLANTATGINDSWSAGVWVNYTGTATRFLFTKYQYGNYTGWYVSCLSSDNLRVYFRDGTNMYKDFAGTGINDGGWHFLTLTYNGSNSLAGIKLYIDGAEQTSTGSSGTSVSGTMETTWQFCIGRATSYGNYYYEGKVLHSYIYDKELTPSEIETIYGGGIPQDLLSVGPTSNLIYWCALGDGCDIQGSGTCPDLSGNGATGTWYSTTRDVSTDVPS